MGWIRIRNSKNSQLDPEQFIPNPQHWLNRYRNLFCWKSSLKITDPSTKVPSLCRWTLKNISTRMSLQKSLILNNLRNTFQRFTSSNCHISSFPHSWSWMSSKQNRVQWTVLLPHTNIFVQRRVKFLLFSFLTGFGGGQLQQHDQMTTNSTTIIHCQKYHQDTDQSSDTLDSSLCVMYCRGSNVDLLSLSTACRSELV